MSTETVTDIAALVGEIEAVPCESDTHGPGPYHDLGAATHYGHVHCECGVNVVKAYCTTFAKALQSPALVECYGCFGSYPAAELVTILGPVTK